MGQLRSYLDKGSSDASWLDAWREKGRVNVWLHKRPPWLRNIHNFWRIDLAEEKGQPVRRIKWSPFVCWEPEAFHRRKKSDNPLAPTMCPLCIFLDWLDSNERIPDDEAIFEYRSARDNRSLIKVDVLGNGEGADSYKDKITPKSDYVFSVIPENDPSGVFLTNETWQLYQSLQDQIKGDMEDLGEDKGNPEKQPICYTFKFNPKATAKYAVSRFAEAELTDRIWELWNGAPPDAGRFCDPGDPVALRKAFGDAWVYECDPETLDHFFEPSLAEWRKTHREKKGEPDSDHEEEGDAPPPRREESHQARQEGRRTRGEAPRDERPVRPVKAAKTASRPPPKVFACGACGKDWPEDKPACPYCGAEEEAVLDAEEQTPKEETTRSERKKPQRGGSLPF